MAGIILNGGGASFISGLSIRDLERLRKVVREKVFTRPHWPAHLKTDAEADRIIEAYGPRTKEALLKQAVDSKFDRGEGDFDIRAINPMAMPDP